MPFFLLIRWISWVSNGNLKTGWLEKKLRCKLQHINERNSKSWTGSLNRDKLQRFMQKFLATPESGAEESRYTQKHLWCSCFFPNRVFRDWRLLDSNHHRKLWSHKSRNFKLNACFVKTWLVTGALFQIENRKEIYMDEKCCQRQKEVLGKNTFHTRQHVTFLKPVMNTPRHSSATLPTTGCVGGYVRVTSAKWCERLVRRVLKK